MLYLTDLLADLSASTKEKMRVLNQHTESLTREFHTRHAVHDDAVSEAKRMVGVSTWRILVTLGSAAAGSWHLIQQAGKA